MCENINYTSCLERYYSINAPLPAKMRISQNSDLILTLEKHVLLILFCFVVEDKLVQFGYKLVYTRGINVAPRISRARDVEMYISASWAEVRVKVSHKQLKNGVLWKGWINPTKERREYD